MPPKSSAGNSPAPSASTIGRRSGRGKANSTDALKGTSQTQTTASTTVNDSSTMKNDNSTTKSSETPSKPLVDPSNPSPWRHPDELSYIKREDWGKNLTVDYLRQRSFSIPQRDTNATVQVFKVTRADSNGRPEIVTLPRGYRVPLLFIAKFQWDSLKLVMTAADPDREWHEYRFDIIHLCRLCHHLFNEAVADEKRIKAKGGKGIEKSWRSKMFDRVLTRFWQRWFVSREWSIRGFWQEFGEEEYEEDVLAHDWVRWAYKGHKGFTLTKDEVVYGVSAQQFMSGLLKAPDGSWTWNAHSPNSNLAQVASANAVPPSTPATLPSTSPPTNNSDASAHTQKADKAVMSSVIADSGSKAPKSSVPITPSQSQQQSAVSLRTLTTESTSSPQPSNSRIAGEKRGREDDNDDRDPKRLRPGSDNNPQPSVTQTTTARNDPPNGVIPLDARPALMSTSSTPQHPVPCPVPSRSPSEMQDNPATSSTAASSAATSSSHQSQPSSGTPAHTPPPQDPTPHRRPVAIDLRHIAASHKPHATPSLPRCSITSPNATSAHTDSLTKGRKILDALLSDPQKIKRLQAIFLLSDVSWFVSTDSPSQQESSGNAVHSSKPSACFLSRFDFLIDGDLNLDEAKDLVMNVCSFLKIHLAHPVYPPSEFDALLERELNALRLESPRSKKMEAGVQTVPETRVLLEKDVDASLPVRVFEDVASMTVSAVTTTLGTQTDPILNADEDEEDRMEVDHQLSSSGSRTPPSLSSDPTMINIDPPTSSRRSKSSTFIDISSNALKTELRSTVGEVINSMMSSVADYLERGNGAVGPSRDVSHDSPIVRVLLEEVKSTKEELKRSQQRSHEDMESLANIYRTELESLRCDIRARDDRYRRDMEATRQKYHHELQDVKEMVTEAEKDREKLEEESRISSSEVLELRKRVSSLEGQMQSRAFSPSGSNYHGWAGGMDISVTRRPSYHPLGHLLSQEDGSSSQHHSGSVSIPSTPIAQDIDRSIGGRDEDDPPPLPIKSQRKFLAVHRLSTSTS